MKNDFIIFSWTEGHKQHIKEIDRENFFNVMDSIRKNFVDNNSISTILCGIIPELVAISINKDRNQELDVPFIQIETKDAIDVVKILRHHKIIWSIFNEYCK